MKKFLMSYLPYVIIFFLSGSFPASAQKQEIPKPLRIGYSLSISSITPEKMNYAKSVGVDCIEISGINGLIDKGTFNFKISAGEIDKLVKKVKKATDDAGIKIWSVHMPFSDKIDLSVANDKERQEVVALHKKILEFCRFLQPEIILFHPSFYLGLNERETRKNQLIKSAIELKEAVTDMHAVIVIENMLGPELLADPKRERPLCRTVEETVEIMNRLPPDIFSAIDMNHIKNPEILIRAMGKRLKTVHISDGNGEQECHYFPCSGQGQNNWTAILSALNSVGYTGPFMYESAFKDVKDMKECYDTFYKKFVMKKS